MSRYSRNRFLPVVLIVVVVIIAIVAIVSLARAIFFSGGDKEPAQIDTSREVLLSPAVDNQVRMTVRGALRADEDFRSFRIKVTPTERSLVTYSGYLSQQLEAVELGNNTPAYEEFIHTLDKANLALGTQFPAEQDNTLGVCATGRLYEFEILKGNAVVKRLWTSTCKGSPGSLQASADQLSNLFYQQIPDSKKIVGQLKL